ncbi:MAG TPA: SBBP repeat-containing protein [Bacteroidales bacterium]|nr:SBBP repeat-containing protein [Bacteroidales bacterium]
MDSYDNIIVTGRANNNYYTIKYDSNGNFVWAREYDGGSYDYGQGVAVDSKNNIIVTGKTDVPPNKGYNYYTIKYDSNGNEIWNARYNGGSTNRARGIAVDSYDNVYVTGFSRLLGIGNIYTIKYDSSGKIIWERSKIMNHRFEIDHENEMNGIAVDSLNNILVTGSIYNGTNWDYYTVKYEGTPPLAKSPPKSLPIHRFLKILNENRCKNHPDAEGCQAG